jgi:hypothetical protein
VTRRDFPVRPHPNSGRRQSGTRVRPRRVNTLPWFAFRDDENEDVQDWDDESADEGPWADEVEDANSEEDEGDKGEDEVSSTPWLVAAGKILEDVLTSKANGSLCLGRPDPPACASRHGRLARAGAGRTASLGPPRRRMQPIGSGRLPPSSIRRVPTDPVPSSCSLRLRSASKAARRCSVSTDKRAGVIRTTSHPPSERLRGYGVCREGAEDDSAHGRSRRSRRGRNQAVAASGVAATRFRRRARTTEDDDSVSSARRSPAGTYNGRPEGERVSPEPRRPRKRASLT